MRERGFALTDEGRNSTLWPLAGIPVLHWHSDRFELPAGGRLLASTARCVQQAYTIGDAVLGLQFHLEADASRIERWLVGHCCELAQAGIAPRTLCGEARIHGEARQAAAEATDLMTNKGWRRLRNIDSMTFRSWEFSKAADDHV